MDFFSGLSFSVAGSNPKYTADNHNNPLYYGIQFNYHGALRLRVGSGREYRVDGPYAFLTYPGTVFDYGSLNGAPRHHNFICAHGPRIERYLKSGLFMRRPETPLVHIANPEKFLQAMLAIMALIRLPGATPARAVLLFEDLLLRMHEAARAEIKPPPYQAECLNTLMEQVCARPEYAWDFQAEAKKCHVTLTHFRRLFKALSGMPPQQFLLHSRLRQAAGLLISTREPVKEIADRVGIANVFYFSRLFRRKYQASPLAYRREFAVKG